MFLRLKHLLFYQCVVRISVIQVFMLSSAKVRLSFEMCKKVLAFFFAYSHSTVIYIAILHIAYGFSETVEDEIGKIIVIL